MKIQLIKIVRSKVNEVVEVKNLKEALARTKRYLASNIVTLEETKVPNTYAVVVWPMGYQVGEVKVLSKLTKSNGKE